MHFSKRQGYSGCKKSYLDAIPVTEAEQISIQRVVKTRVESQSEVILQKKALKLGLMNLYLVL